MPAEIELFPIKRHVGVEKLEMTKAPKVLRRRDVDRGPITSFDQSGGSQNPTHFNSPSGTASPQVRHFHSRFQSRAIGIGPSRTGVRVSPS
jgi:hypothetical protein